VIIKIITAAALELSSFSSTAKTDEVKSDISKMPSLYAQPTTLPDSGASFEFGDFQGSSNTSVNSTSTAATWPTSSTTFSGDDSWATFESAFPPTNPPTTAVTSNAPTTFTQNYTSTENSTFTTTTTTTTTATTTTVDTVNSSDPGQFAVVTSPPTVNSSKVENIGDDMAGDNGDKYAAFASLVNITTHSGGDNDEFGNFEGSQLPTKNDSDVVKVQYFTTQVSR